MILTDNIKIASRFPQISFVKERELTSCRNRDCVRALVCSRGFVSTVLKADLPNLRFIQLLSAGYDGVDLGECSKRGIKVANAANVYSVGIAEFVLLCMLRSAKRYNASIHNSYIRLFRNYKYLTELSEKTVTILGVGGIGGEVAKRAKAFDMRVCGFAINTREKPPFDEIVNTINSLKELLAQSDYVISTLPHNAGTEGLLNKDILECLKDDVTFINIGRRKTLNEDDLYAFLKSHKHATAFLDMLERLPNLITNRFRRLSNVVVLPGVTAISKEIDLRLYQLVETNLNRMSNNETLLNVINHG